MVQRYALRANAPLPTLHTHTNTHTHTHTHTHHTHKHRGEDAQDYTVGVRGVASVSKGHHKMLFSLVFTNAVWVEKVRCVNCVGMGMGLNCMG